MFKKFLLILLSIIIAINIACSTTDKSNVNVNAVGNANIPPEFSSSPVPMSTMPAGIPDPNSNASSVQRGATPIPGIPDEKDINKPFKKGPTPIPGIPDDVIKNNPLNNSTVNANSGKKTPLPKSNSKINSAKIPPLEN